MLSLGLESPHSVITMLSNDNAEAFERWLRQGGHTAPPSPAAGEPKPVNPDVSIPTKAGSLTEEHALTVACRHGALACADVLIRLGTNINFAGTNGYTVCVCVCVCMCVYLRACVL